MLAERGISVDRSTIYRWFIEYSPSLRREILSLSIHQDGLFVAA